MPEFSDSIIASDSRLAPISSTAITVGDIVRRAISIPSARLYPRRSITPRRRHSSTENSQRSSTTATRSNGHSSAIVPTRVRSAVVLPTPGGEYISIPHFVPCHAEKSSSFNDEVAVGILNTSELTSDTPTSLSDSYLACPQIPTRTPPLRLT